MALESLFLQEQAVEAWKRYLVLDTATGWSTEARSHLQSLAQIHPQLDWRQAQAGLERAVEAGDEVSVRRIVSAFRQPSRQFGEEELLPRWGAARTAGREAEARWTLTVARAVGRQYATVANDWMLADAVATIDRAAADPRRSAALSRGHALYAEALQAYEDHHPAAAATSVASARIKFVRAKSPFYLWAELYIAMCQYQLHRYVHALRALENVQRQAGAAHYPSLIGRCQWVRGLIYFVTTQPLAARQSYLTGLTLFERTGELGHQATLQGLLFELYDFLGEDEEAWNRLYRSLSLAGHLGGARQHQLLALEAVAAASRAGEPLAAIDFDTEALRWAEISHSMVAIAYALRDRASLKLRAGRGDDASRDIVAAQRFADHIDNRDVHAEIRLARAEILGKTDRKAALAELSAALPVFESTHFDLRLASVFLQRGKLEVAAGEPMLAESDFRAGIERLGRELRGLDALERGAFLERASELLDEMVRLEAASETGARPNAFANVERAHGCAFAGSGGQAEQGCPSALTLDDVALGLGRGVTMVEYFVLPDRLVAWIVGNRTARSVVMPIAADDLQRSVRRLLSGYQEGTEAKELAGRL